MIIHHARREEGMFGAVSPLRVQALLPTRVRGQAMGQAAGTPKARSARPPPAHAQLAIRSRLGRAGQGKLTDTGRCKQPPHEARRHCWLGALAVVLIEQPGHISKFDPSRSAYTGAGSLPRRASQSRCSRHCRLRGGAGREAFSADIDGMRRCGGAARIAR